MNKLFFASLLIFLLGRISAQPPSLEHIAVYVQDLPKSTAFYQNIMGLDTVPEPFHDGRHTWFAVGGRARLHLIGGAAEINIHDKNSHLCFSVASVPAFMKRLEKAGIPFEDWNGKPQTATVRVDGVRQIYFRDPDGWWIEVNDAK